MPIRRTRWPVNSGNPAVDAEPSMIHATCFLYQPESFWIFKIFSWLHLGDCGFHFLVLGDVFFFGKKWGVLVTFPWRVGTVLMEEIIHQVIHLWKKDGTLKSPTEKDILGFQLLIFRSVGTLLSSSSCFAAGLLRSAGSGLNFHQ